MRVTLVLTLVAAALGNALWSAETPQRLSAPLPDALVASNGTAVTTSGQWLTQRRPELLELFRANVYGRAPLARPAKLAFEVTQKSDALDGLAVHKRVTITYGEGGTAGKLMTEVYYPKNKAPAGCFILIVNRARTIVTDADTVPTEFWPVRDIVARGYATASFHYSDIATDKAAECFKSGVFAQFGPAERSEDSWGALTAWAWGASRVVDFLVTEPELAGVPLAVVGHSRGGKTALWCAAQDTRIAMGVSNDSGAGGAALARRTRGETVAAITRSFPYWFAKNYTKYAENESALPIDQHELIALIAPRRVYVASARDDAWADPEAEFGACVAAGAVFKLFGLEGVGAADMPAVDKPRHDGAIGYHVRPGGHNLLRTDWSYYMDYADRHLRPAGR